MLEATVAILLTLLAFYAAITLGFIYFYIKSMIEIVELFRGQSLIIDNLSRDINITSSKVEAQSLIIDGLNRKIEVISSKVGVHSNVNGKVKKLNIPNDPSLDEVKSDRLFWSILLIATVVTTTLICSLYLEGNEKPLDKFESAAIAINNYLSPILLILTVYLLFQTWKVSKKELNKTSVTLKMQTEAQQLEGSLSLLRERIKTLKSVLNNPPSQLLVYCANFRLKELSSQSANGLLLDEFAKCFLSKLPDDLIHLVPQLDPNKPFDFLDTLCRNFNVEPVTYNTIVSLYGKHTVDSYMKVVNFKEFSHRELLASTRMLRELALHDSLKMYIMCESNPLRISAPLKQQEILAFNMLNSNLGIISAAENEKHKAILNEELIYSFTNAEYEGLKALSRMLPR
ncbi:hypothetical protein A7985_08945 [Pseudoalteromonas luteoviolacea]|uniref:Uncharacterized protein n=1 Tax=Pseudoalteromonas luteoviolacea TaxID=43657 RepID=A0A1C0TRP4_9GAMM|nr:hypothetical protein [Pseudoalteromonas luteoviolacea]OCQ21925.1 hypothetical protein A7985_08945 [Pseudoalteromonas luteoviolacea]